MRDTCWHDKRFPSCNWKLTLFTGWASLVSWSSCKHARMHVCHPTYALCAWAEIGVCEAGYPQCPKLDHLFCLFLFSFCCFFFFFFKFSFEPCVFLDNLNKQSDSVRSVWLLLKRLLHTRNRHDWAQHLFKWIFDTVTKRHEMCFPKGVVFFVFVFLVGGWWGRLNPFFVVGEEGSAEAKWHSEAFVFGSVQSLLKWKQYVRGRQWHLLLASHGNRETDWRQRLLTVADIIKFHEETKPGWNALQNLCFQQKANSQEHDKTGTTMNALQTLSWKIISIIIWYVQLWSYKKAKTLSISFIQIIRKLKLRVCD